MNKTILVSILCFLFSVNVFGATLYVSTSGSDSNPGTQAAPFLTISHCASVAPAGSTCAVQDGTYTFSQLTVSNPITVMSMNKWGAVLQASSGDSTTPFINLDGNDITFQDFEVIGQPGIAEGVKCNGSGQTNCVIEGNKVHDFGVQNTCQSGAAVELGSGVSTGAQVVGNYVYNVGPPRNSGSRCNQYHGIYVGGGTAPKVQDNIVFQVWQGYALHINSQTSVIGAVFANNTVFNSGDNTGGGTGDSSGGPIVLDCHATCSGNVFTNNIFYNTQGPGPYCFREVEESGATIGANTFSNNLLNSCGTNLFVNGNNSLNTTTGNPMFVSYTGDNSGDYHLQSASPAINTGTSLGAPATYFDGSAMSQGLYDIGAQPAISSSGNQPAPPTGLVAIVQ